MTTRQSDDVAGVDILGVASGTPAVYLYDANGNVAMEITDDRAGGVIKFWTNLAGETGRARLRFISQIPAVLVESGQFLTNGDATIGGTLDVGEVDATGDVNTLGRLITQGAPSTTNAVNCRIGGGGVLNIVTSLTKHKHNPKPIPIDRLRALLDVSVVDWVDAGERRGNGGRVKGLRRIPGVLAEDVAAIDPGFADYDDDGELGRPGSRCSSAAAPSPVSASRTCRKQS